MPEPTPPSPNRAIWRKTLVPEAGRRRLTLERPFQDSKYLLIDLDDRNILRLQAGELDELIEQLIEARDLFDPPVPA